MRRILLVALTSAAAIALGVTAVTHALFSAAAPPVHGQFQAGVIELNSYRDQGDTIDGPMFYITAEAGRSDRGQDGRFPTGYWAPGTTESRVLFVENKGTLDAWLESVGATLQPGSSEYLAQKLLVRVSTDEAAYDVLASGTLYDFTAASRAFSRRLAAPAPQGGRRYPQYLWFHVTFPLDADNSYQGLSAVASFRVTAVQARNNP